MAQDSWPSPGHNSREVTDAEYEKIAARFSDDGVWGDPTDTAVVSPGAGLNIDIRAEARASLRGHAWYSGTTTVTLPITANASGSTRIDRVVLRLDRATWDVRAVVKEGTPGAGVPSLSQSVGDTGTYEIPLAEVTLLSGATSVTVVRKELYIGARIRPALESARNPIPRIGEQVYETDTGRVRVWTGSAWVTAHSRSEIVSAASPLAAWSIIVEPVVELRNGSVHFRLGQFQRAGGALGGTVDSRLPILIPAAYRHPTRNVYAIAYISGTRIGRITIYPASHTTPGQAYLTQKPDIATGEHVQPGDISWAVD